MMIWGSLFWLVIGCVLIISSLDKSTLLIDDDNGSLGYLWGPLALLSSFLISFLVEDDEGGLYHIGLNPALNTLTGIVLLLALAFIIRSWKNWDRNGNDD